MVAVDRVDHSGLAHVKTAACAKLDLLERNASIQWFVEPFHTPIRQALLAVVSFRFTFFLLSCFFLCVDIQHERPMAITNYVVAGGRRYATLDNVVMTAACRGVTTASGQVTGYQMPEGGWEIASRTEVAEIIAKSFDFGGMYRLRLLSLCLGEERIEYVPVVVMNYVHVLQVPRYCCLQTANTLRQRRS